MTTVANHANYDDKFKASMVALLVAEGYPDNKFKLAEVAKHAGVPSRTLRRWYLRDVGAPPDNIVMEEKRALADRLEALAHKLVDVAFDLVEDTDDLALQQVVTSMGIVVDKSQLLLGKATERKEVTGKDGGAIETKVTLLSQLSDEELDRIIAGQPPAS